MTLFQNVTLHSFSHTNSYVTLYENTWHKEEPMLEFSANPIHEGSDEDAED